MAFIPQFICVAFAILLVGVVHGVDSKPKIQHLMGPGEEGHRPPEMVDRARCEVSADCDYGHICDEHLRCTMGCKGSFDCFRGHTLLNVLVTTAIASGMVIAARVTVVQNSGHFGSGVGMDDG
ncbi:hypothetical protein Asppvi_002816 [Aspergillus pseudoviridinutans]|uniref:WAP domain-containing protein n=1 Tax=Aspergillus pseudoviridinutans TaxID=1517512 RepID=A0A9P3B742_9EURO|nr:uncharacterized protein Asppvi_002816 [Aspergillus pseudoviridinutans]GIJ83983.1 hypothetical protein Asppvi_002816 [Aspergillus pseudoviridinutans]